MSGLEEAKRAITEVCEALKTSPAIGRAIDDLCAFLIAKNEKYSNSVFEPLRMFSRGSVEDLIRVRLDDKVTRILRGQLAGEDSFDDFAGYMILLRALPIYMRSRSRRFSDDDMGIVALTYNRLCDVAGVEVAERIFLATPAGGDVVEDMQKAIESATRDGVDLTPAYSRSLARGAVPGHVVTQSLRDRGLRAGMTYQEVRDNKWTECAAMSAEGPEPISGWCSESDPCPACKFLDKAMCECGDSYAAHAPNGECPRFDESLFVLASWSPEPSAPPVVFLGNTQDIETVNAPSTPVTIFGLPVTDPSEGIRTQSNERRTLLAVEAAQPKKETNMTDTNETTTTKKPRVDRKTWHETVEGAVAVRLVRDTLESKPPRSYYARELAPITGLDLSVVGLALDRLILTGYAAQHGKAKGTRYAHAGFLTWPAPVPRKRASNEPPVSAEDADAAHSLDASDSEET